MGPCKLYSEHLSIKLIYNEIPKNVFGLLNSVGIKPD